MMSEAVSHRGPASKDRRIGMIIFGILEVVLGGCCVLLTLPLIFFLFAGSQAESGLEPRVMAGGIVIYALCGAGLIWLGIGSILCRRWARALLLILAWGWFLAGVASLGFYIVFINKIAAAGAGNPMTRVILIFTMIFQIVFFVIVPGAMILFYRSSRVEATCAAIDTRIRWTDRCSVPVLAAAWWLALGALSLLLLPIMYRSVFPWFGRLLTGIPATVILLCSAAFCFYLAWETYRMKMFAWWGTLAAFLLLGLSSAVTFTKVDLFQFYQTMGYPQQQIDQMRNLGVLPGNAMVWWTMGFVLLFVIYMIWIRKYFLPPPGGTGDSKA